MASASFTSSADGLTVTFINTSTGGRYLWDFGDGNTTNSFSPVYTYAKSGTYSVALTAIDSAGTSTIANEITASRPGELLESWSLPFTVPIVFNGLGEPFETGNLNYNGSWHTYPKITIMGPYSGARILNKGTGVAFSLPVGIPSGQTRIISYDIGSFSWSITDADGNDKFYESEPNSPFVKFSIQPRNLIKNRQSISVRLNNIGPTTSVQIEYHVAEFGQ